MIPFDLHLHSCYSGDGEKAPLELIQLAKEAGLNTIALSDHNTPAGIDEMMELGKQHHIRIIPAMEFDTLFHDLEIHVLGYNFDYHRDYFENLLDNLKQRKQEAIPRRLQKLNEVYHMELTMEEVLAKYPEERPWPAVIKAAVEDPRYASIKAFDDYRVGGVRCNPQSVNFYWDLCCPGTACYERVEYPSLQETVKQIHDAGGIAVIAHPWRNFDHREDLLRQAIKEGIDGIEAYSNYHNSEQNAFYEQYCQEHDILMTCGSDYHGKFKPDIHMGEFGYQKQDAQHILEKFLARLKK